jgi:type VI secretion system secreted protein Hcp
MAADYFLKINGIPGESVKDKHKDEIELHSWSWSQTNSGSHAANTGGGQGRVDMEDFEFQMTTNKASTELFLHCANGKHIPDAILACRQQGGKQQEYLKIKFTDLVVSSFKLGGSNDDKTTVKPMETIKFNFAKIEFSYSQQDKDGSQKPWATKWYNVKETTFG